MSFLRYRVFITPLLSDDTYDSAQDVSDYIDASGVPNVNRSIDAGDYDVGVYSYNDITIKGQNSNGIFNGPEDSRSIFPFGRDRAKVEVHFIEMDTSLGTETSTTTFRGLINEEATRIDPVSDSIRMRVLSRDSIIRNTKIQSGAIANGSTSTDAIKTILNTTRIRSVLTFNAANINPDFEYTIDDGSYFDNKKTQEALNELLVTTNSVFVLDSSDNMIVKSRDETVASALNLYGRYDLHGRENIIKISKYNSGWHRMFTSVKVGTQVSVNTALADQYGVRQKDVDFDFITTNATKKSIADRLLSEFQAPKIELECEIDTVTASAYDLLAPVSVNFPLRLQPDAGNELPIVGITKIDEATEPLPNEYGSLEIDPSIAFKIIGIQENVKAFTTTLKLRQVGTTLSDGVF